MRSWVQSPASPEASCVFFSHEWEIYPLLFSILTSRDALWPEVLLCLMCCFNCCRPSSTACCSNSPALVASLTQPSPEIDLSSSTHDFSLARFPRTRCKRGRGSINKSEQKQKRLFRFHNLTANGSRHSGCLLMAYRLSSGIRLGPSRLHAKDKKSSKASQSTRQVSDHQGGDASTISTRAGRLDEGHKTGLPASAHDPDLFLRRI